MLDSNFWKGRLVFLTGHTGFKGAWLTSWLNKLGADVTGYSLQPPTKPSLYEICKINDPVASNISDIRDISNLKSGMIDSNAEVVIHMAAQPLVRYSYYNPLETYATNVMGTANLLEAVRCCGSVRAVVNITSDKCYENREWVWGYRENDPMGGYDPYSSSKGCAELVTSAYLRSFFSPEDYGKKHHVAVASVRAGNVIGGGDWGEDRLIPDCIRALSQRKEIVIRNPSAIRPWQHVLEPLSGYLMLCVKLLEEGPAYSGAWNFGPRDDMVWTVEDVVKEIIRLWGDGSYRVESRGNPHEAYSLKLDCSKARIDLGWKPRYSVKEALKKTVDWYKMFYQGGKSEDMMEFTRRQIDEYLEILELKAVHLTPRRNKGEVRFHGAGAEGKIGGEGLKRGL